MDEEGIPVCEASMLLRSERHWPLGATLHFPYISHAPDRLSHASVGATLESAVASNIESAVGIASPAAGCAILYL